MAELVTLRTDGPVGYLTLNRPEARNALSIEMLEELDDVLTDLEQRAGLSVLVVAGAPPVFCAGMDLRAVLDSDEAPSKLLHALAEQMMRLRLLPMASVASVHGAAIGGGCGLACVCDFALTHDDAKLGFPEVDLGVCPAVVAPWVVRRLGFGRARQVLLVGGTMDGREAARIGLVTRSVETSEALDAEVSRLVDELARGGPAAMRATKMFLNELDGSLEGELAKRSADISASVLRTEEARRGLRARMSKKK